MQKSADRLHGGDASPPPDDLLNAEFEGEPLLFDARVDPEIDKRLRKAVAARRRYRFETERLLWQAQADDPSYLPVYFALYKFYSHGRRLNDASRALRLALTEAARQGGFHCDWTKLNTPPDTAVVDFYASEPGLFYLLSLKALAFIRLRQGRREEAVTLLEHLARLDRDDRSGASTLRLLATSLDGCDHDQSH